MPKELKDVGSCLSGCGCLLMLVGGVLIVLGLAVVASLV